MRHHKTKEMLAYWNSLFGTTNTNSGTGQRPVWPERCDIQPADCRTLLSNMFILDLENGAVNYRLAGTQLCSLHGRELKQENFPSVFAAGDQRAAETWATHLDVDEIVVLLCTEGENERGEKVLLETLLMPLNNNGNGRDRVLGITSACDPESWVGNVPIKSQTIKSVRILKPWENTSGSLETPIHALDRQRENEIRQSVMQAENIVPFHASTLSHHTKPRDSRNTGLDFSNVATHEEPLRQFGHLHLIEGGKDK